MERYQYKSNKSQIHSLKVKIIAVTLIPNMHVRAQKLYDN